ncbi:MAG TPA: hypothetical protein PLP19_08420 [bacterium]|nr:hypothetical protein [bacterium]HPN43498.1 hypothetical protein [bacterium]
MKVLRILFTGLLIHFIAVSIIFAQGKPYEGPEDGAGDKAAERVGFMEGNNVRLQFRNTTELSDHGDGADPFPSKWPNNLNGVHSNDGIGLLIGAQVFVKKDPAAAVDSVIVDDMNLAASLKTQGLLDTLHFLQTSYREEMDRDPTGQIEWKLYPVRGYFNWTSETPALSDREESWPPAGWPERGVGLKWAGEWNGRFGRGPSKADLESFFVANDAQDQEYLQDTFITNEGDTLKPIKYYPRPGIKIGDFHPEVTLQWGKPWGGLGLRIEQRGFQWNNPQAKDAIFWEYTIANVSDYDLNEMAFGYWVDNAIGGQAEGSDELGAFRKDIDLAYSWDIDGHGVRDLPTGAMGFAFLESPGIPWDGIDNDDDGIIDEKRDNFAQALIGPTDGYSNLEAFKTFYHLKDEELKSHWDADEDQDWDDGNDANGDNKYQEDEDYGDDVGTDGVGPLDLNYDQPDANGTECNHRPDFIEGLGGEPDFGILDVSESDMLGLTSFYMFPIPDHVVPYTHWFRNDKSMWELIGADSLNPYMGEISNLAEVFASAVFPLYKGRTERISMSELHAWDDLAGLNAIPPTSPNLFKAKEIVQVIYETDYRFAKPPIMPALTATAGDGCVYLTWDNISELRTRDPFLKNVNDFEGYKLYRSTEPGFLDATIVTDGFGSKVSKKPIFMCDVKDERTGYANYGQVEDLGVAVYLGNDTGLLHSYTDYEVQNGRTYYYALVAYDYGEPTIGSTGLAPAENNIIIQLDKNEQIITFQSKNVAVVTPGQKAAGYHFESTVTMEGQDKVIGCGILEPEVVVADALKKDHRYKIKFGVHEIRRVNKSAYGIKWVNNSITVYDMTNDNAVAFLDTCQLQQTVIADSTETLGYKFIKTGTNTTDVFDGIRLKVTMPVKEGEYDPLRSGWLKGNSPISVTMTAEESKYYPYTYNIVFTDNDSDYTSKTRITATSLIKDENGVKIKEGLIQFQNFSFHVENTSIMDSTTGQPFIMEMVAQDIDGNGTFELLKDRVVVGIQNDLGRWASTVFLIDFKNANNESDLPKADDVYQVRFNSPFWHTDSLMFTIDSNEFTEKAEITNSLDKIEVVPNPYVATNLMEPAVGNPYLNQRRRIIFTNIPARCSINIFTVSGVLVDQIDVNNDISEGIVHWDLLTREGLEVAAGVYIYHIKVLETGDEKMGKFAIIK